MTARWLLPVVLALAAAPLASAQEAAPAGWKAIEPFLDAQTIAVGRLDVRKIDVAAATDLFTKDIPEDVLPRRQRDEGTAKGVALREKFLQAGFAEVYVVVSLADLPRNGPFVVLPGKEGKPETLEALLKEMGIGARTDSIRGAVVAGSTETLARVRDMTSVPRPDLAKALAAAGDAAVQLAVSPADDTRRVVRETLPALPPELGGATGAELADSFQWLAAAGNLPPRMSLAVTVRAKDARAAAQLRAIAASGLGLLAKNENVKREFPPIGGLAPLLVPKVEQDRLVLKIDEREGNLTKVIDELVKPAIAGARAAAQRAASTNNLKQLMLAMHNYHDTYSKFPPQATRKEDKKLLSWRVQLLPFIEHSDLYDQFHHDEPWDSEHNKKLIEKMPPVFASPNLPREAKSGLTTYLVPVGPKTVFEGSEGISFAKLLDGTSNTIAIVEVAPEHAVVWTKPEDWAVDFSDVFKGLVGKKPPAGATKKAPGFNAALCDGSVRFISEAVDKETLRRLLQKDDGEPVGEF